MNTLEIKLKNLEKAEYLVVMVYNNDGKVETEVYRHTFSFLLDLFANEEDSSLEEAVNELNIPIYGQVHYEPYKFDEYSECGEIVKIIRIK